MDNYIGVKLIKAKPMKLGAFNDHIGKKTTGVDNEREGFLVVYADGYESWSPKDAFENSYLKLKDNKRINKEDILSFVSGSKITKLGNKTTLVTTTAKTGFEIHKTASCVNDEEYDEKIGGQICFNKVQDFLYEHLGFVLQWAKNGLNKKGER